MTTAPDDLRWVNEARMLALTGLPRSTFQAWRRAKFVEPLPAYGEGDVLEMAIAAELRRHLRPDEATRAWAALRESGDLDAFVNVARRLEEGDRFDLVIEPNHLGVTLATDDASLVAAVRHPTAPRPVVVVALAEQLRHIRDSVRRTGITAARPKERRPGRPSRHAVVHQLRRET